MKTPQIATVLLLIFLMRLDIPFALAKDRPSESLQHPSEPGVARSLGKAFADVAEKVSPSVVIIITVTQGMEEASPENRDDEQMPNPFDFFHRNPHRMPPPEAESRGSGFIVRQDGYIYTNYHVIRNASQIQVRLKDGRSFEARVVGTPDEKTDVAVIKIDAKDLPAVELGDSDAIRPGEWTVAIGAPFSLDYSVTVGVLSGKVRDHLGAVTYEEYLQTQATINPGNSGGPLLDIDGKVIGINTLIRTRPGGGFNFYNANVGFAIPIKLAQKIGNLLITKGKVERPWIGVNIRTLEEAKEVKDVIQGVSKGVLVQGIRRDTPAADSELRPGDVITAIDKVGVETAKDLQNQVLEKQIGQTVNLSVVRDGKPMEIPIKTGLQPSNNELVAAHVKPSRLPVVQSNGISIQTLTQKLAEQYDISEKEGVFVLDVEEDSYAARSGLIPGMVITEVAGKPVLSAKAFREVMKKADLRKGVILQVERNGVRSFVVLKSDPDQLQEEKAE